MGNLIEVSKFHANDQKTASLNASWYFPDAYFDSYRSRSVRFTVESGYPFSCAIHQDHLNGDYEDRREKGFIRMIMRRWIERHLEGDVIYEHKNMEYRVQLKPTEGSPYPQPYFISHGYYIFHFETEAEMLHFRLKFSDIVGEISKVHPEKGWSEEFIDRYP